MDWAKNLEIMWEKLWDLLIYPIIEIVNPELAAELKASREEDAE